MSQRLFVIVIATMSGAAGAYSSQNPFLELVDVLTGTDSGDPQRFNGPDRGGQHTFHGEVDGREFEFVSDEYAAVDGGTRFFPLGFPAQAVENDLDIQVGVPEFMHAAFYVRCAVEHEDSEDADGAWPIRASSMIHYLPPWSVPAQ